jgi:hypothetical protein
VSCCFSSQHRSSGTRAENKEGLATVASFIAIAVAASYMSDIEVND